MNALDVILLLATAAIVVRGYRSGLLEQLSSLFGLIIAVVIAVRLAPTISNSLSQTISKSWIMIGGALILTLVFSSLFEFAAAKLFKKIKTDQKLNELNSILGTVLSVVFAIILFWVFGILFFYGPSKLVASQIHGSTILSRLENLMPEPPTRLKQAQTYLANLNLPQVFIADEPVPAPVSPSLAPTNLASIQAAVGDSVVKITGYGCGGILEGSGFVATDGIVMTNAHVVAGVSRPNVRDRAGNHAARVVYFNPDLDVALLRTTGLHGQPLPLDTQIIPRGGFGVVLGYPNNGPLIADDATVLERILARGSNIYNHGETVRSVYSLQANVQPGSSGGPLVLSNHQVAALIFAKSPAYPDVGYAITADQLAPVLAQFQNNSPVARTFCAE